jgi:hypothetical protein
VAVSFADDLISIIAITGMDGHAYGSWMSREGDNSAMWLRDFLAQDLPDCRTMIYGYHSKLLATNTSQLKEYGRLFFAEFEKIRDTRKVSKTLNKSSKLMVTRKSFKNGH